MAKFNLKEIKGVIPALITCFDEHENLDEKAMREVVRYLLKSEIGGLYLTGSTGETFLMTIEERNRVVDIVIDEVKGKVPIIVHVGDIGTKKSIELAKHAYEAGADAISSVPPFYWKFSDEDVISYYRDVTAATPLPMIVYNIPLAGLVGYDMIKKLAQIDGIEGIKYTAATHYEMKRIKEEIGREFMVYSGSDEMAVSGLCYGADGLIGSFYNLMPEAFVKIQNAYETGQIKKAEEIQNVANKIIFEALKYDYIALMKRLITNMGVEAGYSRKPFKNYMSKEVEKSLEGFRKIAMENESHGIKFLDYLKNKS